MNNDVIDQTQGQLYRNSDLINSYNLVSGNFVLPVAESPPDDSPLWTPVVVVKGFADYRVRTVNYVARKDYNPPQIPTPTDSGSFIFLGGGVSMPLPCGNSGGGLTWTAGTEYTYVENANTTADMGFILGDLPYLYGIQIDNISDFSTSVPGAPTSIQSAGLGPRVGYNMGNTIDFTEPFYFYCEPSYYPANFFSDGIIVGGSPSNYAEATDLEAP